MPCTMKVVSAWIRMDMRRLGPSLHLRDRAAGALVQGAAAVAVLDAPALQDLEPLVLPGARDAEDRDGLARLAAGLEAALHHAARPDVDARGRDHGHHHP